MRLRVITNSERSTFACEKKWGFKYLDGLTRYGTAALRQGDLAHQALEAIYRAELKITMTDIEDLVFRPWWEKRQEFWGSISSDLAIEHADDWCDEKLEEDKAIGAQTRGMIAGYLDFAAGDLDEWEILGIEHQIARVIPDPRLASAPLEDEIIVKGIRHSRRWVYGGKIDMRARSRDDGGIYHWEHKTTSATDLDKYTSKLDFNPQILGYGWAALDPCEGATEMEPYVCRGVIYNVLRKAVPNIPKVKKDGTTSRAACDTTKEVFKRTLLERGEDPDDFVDTIAKMKDSSEFFHRKRHVFTEQELHEFGREISWGALSMLEASKRPYHPRQTQACTGPASYPCEYRDICLRDGPDMRAGYHVKTIRHEELEGVLAEPDCGVERGLHAGPTDDRPIEDFDDFGDDLIF